MDVFIMLAKLGGPEALGYSIEANRLARDLLDHNQGNDDLVEIFYLTQDLLRKEQAEASAARDRPVVGQQTANIGPANVFAPPTPRPLVSVSSGPRPPPVKWARKVSYIEQDGTRKTRTPALWTIEEEDEAE